MPGAYDKSYSWAYDTGCAWYPHCKPCETAGSLWIMGNTADIERVTDSQRDWLISLRRGVRNLNVDTEGNVLAWERDFCALLDPAGNELWSYAPPEIDDQLVDVADWLSGFITADARCLMFCNEYIPWPDVGNLIALSIEKDGSYSLVNRWLYSTTPGASVIDGDDLGGWVWALNTTTLQRCDAGGNVMWFKDIDGSNQLRIDPTNGDTVVYDSSARMIRRYTINGDERSDGSWPVAQDVTRMCLDGNGNTYITNVTEMIAYNPGGSVLWSYATGGLTLTDIEIDGNGLVYARSGTQGESVTLVKGGQYVGSYQVGWAAVTYDIDVQPGRAGAFR